jgi:3-oxoacyl-[acyl-carrier protein] reductase
VNVNINGKKVLITASSEGIGFGIAKKLAREGCRLVLTSRNKEKLNKAVESLKKYNPEVYGFQSDLSKLDSLDDLVNFALEKLGNDIDALIYNTGNPPSEPSTFAETTMEDWLYSVNLYLLSAIKLTKSLLPHMVRKRSGRLIYLSSWTVKQPQSIFVLADVSRSPLIQLVKVVSKDYGQFNVTANVILMGSFETEGAKRSLRRLAEKLGISFDELWQKEVISRSPLKRTGDVEKELGSLITYLLSEFSSYITGSVIQIDGGTSDAI